MLQVGTSTTGIGAAILQKGISVAFVSKTLSVPETRYSNIEREKLAIIFGLERFHCYVWGHKITIQTDHKLLESIVLKNISQAPQDLQECYWKLKDMTLQWNIPQEEQYRLKTANYEYRQDPASTLKELVSVSTVQWHSLISHQPG